MYMRILPIIFSSLLFMQANTAFAQKTTLRTDNSLDVSFYHLRLSLPLDKSALKGEADCYFTTDAKEVKLDLHSDFKISKIEGASNFAHAKHSINIALAPEATQADGRKKITIFYEGTPPLVEENGVAKGLIFKQVGEEKTPVIATIIEPDQAHFWFPCHNVFGDKADSMQVEITLPERDATFKDDKGKAQKVPIMAVSNGKLIATNKDKGNRTYVWKHSFPIHPQYAMIAVGDFAKSTQPWRDDETGLKFPIHFYIRPADMPESQAMMARSMEIMTCLSNTFGAYPYHREGLSIINVAGINTGQYGTNSQSAILMQDMQGIHMYRLVHSLSHMWFGNHITPENWQDSWLTEALATYGESVWHEYKRSVRGYLNMMAEKEFYGRGKLYLDMPVDYSEELIKKKGIWVVHMLRGVLGDKYFYETLKGITEGKRLKKSSISTKDFQEMAEYYASENVTQKYDYFFKQWVYGELYPTFDVSFENVKKQGVKLIVAQTSLTTLPSNFQMPIKVELTFADGTKSIENFQINAAPLQSQIIAATKEVVDIDFDHGMRVLKKLNYTRFIIDTKSPIYDFSVIPTDDRREFLLQFKTDKKQNIKVELIQVADQIELTADKVIATQDFPSFKDEFKQNFKIPLPLEKRNNYYVRVTGKSDVYTYKLILLQLVNKFEKTEE